MSCNNSGHVSDCKCMGYGVGEPMKHNAGPDKNVDRYMTKQKWKDIAEQLWGLLDDIDTASDMFHPVKNNFYEYAMRKVAKRFKLMGSDGYNTFPIKEEKKNGPSIN